MRPFDRWSDPLYLVLLDLATVRELFVSWVSWFVGSQVGRLVCRFAGVLAVCFVRLLNRWFIWRFVLSFIQFSLIRSFIHSITCLFVYFLFVISFTKSVVHSLLPVIIRSFVHSFIQTFVHSFDRVRRFIMSIVGGSFTQSSLKNNHYNKQSMSKQASEQTNEQAISQIKQTSNKLQQIVRKKVQ